MVFIKDGSKVISYHDGINVNEDLDRSQCETSSNSPLLIGVPDEAGPIVYRFKGYLDDLRIYNRALSADEINCLNDE